MNRERSASSALIGLSYLATFLPAEAVLPESSTMNETPRVGWDSLVGDRVLPRAWSILTLAPARIAARGKASGGDVNDSAQGHRAGAPSRE